MLSYLITLDPLGGGIAVGSLSLALSLSASLSLSLINYNTFPLQMFTHILFRDDLESTIYYKNSSTLGDTVFYILVDNFKKDKGKKKTRTNYPNYAYQKVQWDPDPRILLDLRNEKLTFNKSEFHTAIVALQILTETISLYSRCNTLLKRLGRSVPW